MATEATDKAAELLGKLKADRGFRAEFARDPVTAILAAGIEIPDSVRECEVEILEAGDALSIQFATPAPELKWPYRCYFLENRTDRKLNLESWRHIGGIGSQERAVEVPVGKTVALRIATLEELLWNQCNLSNNSHLVRDLTNDKVIKESFTCTCGETANYWVAKGKGDAITCTETHPQIAVVALKSAKGAFVSAQQGGGGKVSATGEAWGPRETFLMIPQSDDAATFMTEQLYFLRAEGGGGDAIVANRSIAEDWEKFRWASVDGDKISLRADNGQYVNAEDGGGRGLWATSLKVDEYAKFSLLKK